MVYTKLFFKKRSMLTAICTIFFINFNINNPVTLHHGQILALGTLQIMYAHARDNFSRISVLLVMSMLTEVETQRAEQRERKDRGMRESSSYCTSRKADSYGKVNKSYIHHQLQPCGKVKLKYDRVFRQDSCSLVSLR